MRIHRGEIYYINKVDGMTLKPDTWYTLKDGEFVESPDD